MADKICYFDKFRRFHVYETHPCGSTREWTTTRAHPDGYARFDEPERGYPQVCDQGGRLGYTITYHPNDKHIPAQFAREIGARLYKTEGGFIRAKALLAA